MIYYKKRKLQNVEIEEPFPINTNEEKICLSDFIEKEHTVVEIDSDIEFSLAGSK